MSMSNRYELETVARQHQRQVEKDLRVSALLRNDRLSRAMTDPKIRRLVGATAVLVASLISAIVLVFLR